MHGERFRRPDAGRFDRQTDRLVGAKRRHGVHGCPRDGSGDRDRRPASSRRPLPRPVRAGSIECDRGWCDARGKRESLSGGPRSEPLAHHGGRRARRLLRARDAALPRARPRTHDGIVERRGRAAGAAGRRRHDSALRCRRNRRRSCVCGRIDARAPDRDRDRGAQHSRRPRRQPRARPSWRLGQAAAGWSIFSSLPQPLLAVPAFLFVDTFESILPAALGFAAGAMVWMVLGELLPEALETTPPRIVAFVGGTAFGLMLGFQLLLS